MNIWLRERALTFQTSRYSSVHVLSDSTKRVLGFFTLSSYTIHMSKLDAATKRQHHEFAGNLPAILIGKLARDVSVRDRKVGEYILKQALLKALEIANTGLGCVLVAVEAEENRIPWYQDHDFTRASAQSKLLYLPMADIEHSVQEVELKESCLAGVGVQEKSVP